MKFTEIWDEAFKNIEEIDLATRDEVADFYVINRHLTSKQWSLVCAYLFGKLKEARAELDEMKNS